MVSDDNAICDLAVLTTDIVVCGVVAVRKNVVVWKDVRSMKLSGP